MSELLWESSSQVLGQRAGAHSLIAELCMTGKQVGNIYTVNTLDRRKTRVDGARQCGSSLYLLRMISSLKFMRCLFMDLSV